MDPVLVDSNNTSEVGARIAALQTEAMTALAPYEDGKTDVPVEVLTRAKAIREEIEPLKSRLITLNGNADAAAIRAQMLADQQAMSSTRSNMLGTPGGATNALGELLSAGSGIRIPANAKKYSKLEYLKDDRRAYAWGQYWRAVINNFHNNAARFEECNNWLAENGINVSPKGSRAMSGNDDTAGGYLIPDLLSVDIINLKESYGQFRMNTFVVPMGGGTLTFPRRKAGVTAQWVGQNSSTTASNPRFNNVQLNPKKLSALCAIPNELAEDAIINIGDFVAGEIGYAFALEEDVAGFTGDASALHGGITGVTNKLIGVDGTIANIKGLTVATGSGYATSYAAITRADIHKTKSLLPAYALRSPKTKWFMSSTVWAQVIESLAAALGGATMKEFEDGLNPKLLGYPVEICQALPISPAVNQVVILFGDLSMASTLGERAEFRIKATQEGQFFDNDQTGIKGTERIDIVVHDVGDTTVAGPIVGLITAAS